MPALLLVLVLLLAGCVPGAGRSASDAIPTADAPFTLTALDVGHPTFRFRGVDVTWCHYTWPGRDSPMRARLRRCHNPSAEAPKLA